MSNILDGLDLPFTLGIESPFLQEKVVQLSTGFQSSTKHLIKSILSIIYLVLHAFSTLPHVNHVPFNELELEFGVIGYGMVTHLLLCEMQRVFQESPPPILPSRIYYASRTGSACTPPESDRFIFTHDLLRTLNTHFVILACPYENLMQLGRMYSPFIKSRPFLLSIQAALLPLTLQRCFPELPTSTLQVYAPQETLSWINGVGCIGAILRYFFGFHQHSWIPSKANTAIK
ncbi:hypothetical protein HMI55_002761 [Coelomomyces lativittatus]|nr:hypothetical protein HMI55_002761 [Coelomomyces lativittatus]